MLRRRPDMMKDGAVGFFGVDQKLRTCSGTIDNTSTGSSFAGNT